MTLTCFDADIESRLKDTVNVALSKEEYSGIKEHRLNKTFTFHVSEIQDAAHGLGSIADWIQREQRRNRFH